jgi:hypothetical protein
VDGDRGGSKLEEVGKVHLGQQGGLAIGREHLWPRGVAALGRIERLFTVWLNTQPCVTALRSAAGQTWSSQAPSAA